jgi:flagellar basal-body rod protein FlgB
MIFMDTTTSAVQWALTAESERQRVTANNVANLATPGFKSQRLSFESSLDRALSVGDLGQAGWSRTNAGTPVGLNGNDVSLEEETQIQMKSGLHYDALVQAMNFKFGTLRSAIGR